MPTPPDKTGYRPGDASDRPPRELAPTDAPLDDDDLARLIVKRTAFPGLMLATGILWILAGGAYVALFALFRLLGLPLQGGDFWLLFGAAFFIKDGIQLIRGKFRDPLLDGIITIGIGLFFMGDGWYRFADDGSVGAILFGAFFGSIFLVPGVLVLVGRKQYLAWKAEQENLATD